MNKPYYPQFICSNCAHKAGGHWNIGRVATFHEGICEVCKINSNISSPRNWGYPKFSSLII